MPVSPTYPGVYINELPSAVRTIVGVPTAVAAFVGTAARGPVDAAVHITSWADFERIFGGLSGSPLGYAVYLYYLNGGSEAEIVRVVSAGAVGPPAVAGAVASTIDLRDGVTVTAKYPGAWGNSLRARVDHDTREPAVGENKDDLYNLTVRDTGTGADESFRNIVAKPTSPFSLARMLAGSRLVTGSGVLDKQPKAHNAVAAGQDPFAGGPAGAPATFAQGIDGADGAVPDGHAYRAGLELLRATDIFNMLVLAPASADAMTADVEQDTLAAAAKLCIDRRAILLVDPPKQWTDIATAVAGPLPVTGDNAKNAALYFPRLTITDVAGQAVEFPPAGAVAGVFARTDGQRGVWKAPAGTDASISGIRALAVGVTDLENGRLNPLGVNCLRTLPAAGAVVWGARTLRGADRLADQWKYLPVRRTALFIEESLYRGTQWVVFEPNDEPLWSSVRLNVGSFMNSLFRQGAFQGRTPQEAYLVKCDQENNPQNDIDRGIVNILVGFAPLKPAEFVIIHIQQLAGQLQT